MTSTYLPASSEHSRLSDLEALYSWLSDPPATPTVTLSPEELDGRLERLAFPTEGATGAVRAPLEACRITTEEHGDLYRATDEYVRWFLSAYPKSRGDDRAQRPAARPASPAVGSKPLTF